MAMFTRIISLTPAIIREQQTQPAPIPQWLNCKQPAQQARLVPTELAGQSLAALTRNAELTVLPARHSASTVMFIKTTSHTPAIIREQLVQHAQILQQLN
jgi:hypothetical protein